MEGEIIDGISEDGFLDHDNIGTGFLDLLDETSNISSFFLQDSVHGIVIVDDNVVFNISLGGGQAELDQSDLGLLNLGGTTSLVGDLIVGEDETINEFRVIDSTTLLSDNLNVIKINIVFNSGVNDL